MKMNLRKLFKMKFFNKFPSMKKLIPAPLEKFFKEYCHNSNIHGVRYFSIKCLHWSERMWWVLFIAVSLTLCGLMIKSTWDQWQLKPVVIRPTEKKATITKIPFPTVTICPEIQTDKDDFDISATLMKLPHLNAKQTRTLNALAHVCPRLSESIDFKDNFTSDNIYEILESIEMLFSLQECSWAGQTMTLYSCLQFVESIATENGMCITFNALNSYDTYTTEVAPEMITLKTKPNVSYWNLDDGYIDQSMMNHEPYPERTGIASPGKNFIITIVIDKLQYEYQCRGSYHGFKMILTTPGETLKTSRNVFQIPLSEKSMVAIKPKLITTSEGLRNYEPNQRQCFYQHERRLRFFKMYTQSNCEEECLSNFTENECGCVKFSMPRDKITKICGATKIKCYNRAESKFWSSANPFRDECNCLPACTSIQYNAEIDRAIIDLNVFSKHRATSPKDIEEISQGSVINLVVFYKDSEIETMKRMEVYTFYNFLAICGGFLGLFMGVSVLSIIELIYYLTLRWLLRIRRRLIVVNNTPLNRSKWINFILTRIIGPIKEYFTELCSKSNIHGVRYFTEKSLHWSERSWWLISVGISLWLCSLMILNVWNQWQENPVSMSAIGDVTISTIPFPTLTICPKIKAVGRKINLMMTFLVIEKENISNLDDLRLNSYYHMCSHADTSLIFMDSSGWSRSFMNESIYDVIEDMAPQLNDTFFKCWWKNEMVNCSKYFVPVFTQEGFCFSFNDLNSHEIYTDAMARGMMNLNTNPNVSHWNRENGYDQDKSEAEYPIRISELGGAIALQVALQTNEDDFDYLCGGLQQEFRMFLSTPGDSLYGRMPLHVPISDNIQLSVSSKLTTTSDGLRRYAPHSRQCYYSSERTLKFFKEYTEQNCIAECMAMYIKHKCNCVHFSMPREKHTQICDRDHLKCYKTNKFQFHLNRAVFPNVTCDCLPACISIEYNAVIDRVKFNTTAANKVSGLKPGFYQTRFSISFNDRVERMQRVELYTFADFLAICGGLLGLFMGISALSVVELVYFCTLRWFWIMRRSRENVVAPQ